MAKTYKIKVEAEIPKKDVKKLKYLKSAIMDFKKKYKVKFNIEEK